VESWGSAHRGYFRPTEWHLVVTGSKCFETLWVGSFLFLAEIIKKMFRLSYFPCWLRIPSSDPKKFFSVVQNYLIIPFLNSFSRSAVRPNRCSSEPLFVRKHLFWSPKVAWFGWFQDILSYCNAVSAISTFRYTARALDVISLPLYRIRPFLYCNWLKSLGSLTEYLNVTCIFTYGIPMIHLVNP
jgi:hypothetical protein